jgi:hypothetical protein
MSEDPDVLAAEQRAAQHRSVLLEMLSALRSGKCDVSRLEDALRQFLLAQEAAASARLDAAQAEKWAMYDKLCASEASACQRDLSRLEALLSLTEFCDQLRLRAEQCTCPAAIAIPLRSFWLPSRNADDAAAPSSPAR